MAKNTEIAKQEEMEVMSFDAFKTEEPVVGLDVNASDIKMPKVKLLQATSQELTKHRGKVFAGQYFNTVTQEAKDTIDCILLDQGKSMIYWNTPFKRGEDPLCRSFDGKKKIEGCGDGNCATCQYSSQNPSAWNNLKAGSTKPPCNMSYVFLAIDCATGAPFRFIASGASVKTTKDFLNKLIPLKVAPFCCKVTLTAKEESNDSGTFFITEFSNLRQNTDLLENGKLNRDKYNELRDLSVTLKNIFMTEIVQNDIVDVEHAADTSSANGGLF